MLIVNRLQLVLKAVLRDCLYSSLPRSGLVHPGRDNYYNLQEEVSPVVTQYWYAHCVPQSNSIRYMVIERSV